MGLNRKLLRRLATLFSHVLEVDLVQVHHKTYIMVIYQTYTTSERRFNLKIKNIILTSKIINPPEPLLLNQKMTVGMLRTQ